MKNISFLVISFLMANSYVFADVSITPAQVVWGISETVELDVDVDPEGLTPPTTDCCQLGGTQWEYRSHELTSLTGDVTGSTPWFLDTAQTGTKTVDATVEITWYCTGSGVTETTTESVQATKKVGKVTKIEVDGADTHSKHIDVSGNKDIIAAIKKSGSKVTLKAVVTPDDQEVKDALVWTGATQLTAKDTATVTRASAAKTEVSVQIGSGTASKREATVWVIWAEFTAGLATTHYSENTIAPAPVLGTPANQSANGCEIEITVLPSGVNAIKSKLSLDIKRKITGLKGIKISGNWTTNPNDPLWFWTNKDDDASNADEHLVLTTNDHIYVADAPGQVMPTPSSGDEEFIFKFNANEWVEVTISGATKERCSDDYNWQTSMRLEVDVNNTWQRMSTDNFIKSGHMTGPQSPPNP